MNKYKAKYYFSKYVPMICLAAVSLPIGNTHAEVLDSLTVSGSLFSEPIHLGLSEADNEPGAALSLDYEITEHFYFGANGYRATNSKIPNRSQNYNIYAGTHWGKSDSIQFDLTLIRRFYPGDFPVDWDFTELQLDTHFSDNFTLSVIGANKYYGLNGANSLGVVGSYVHDFTDKLFARAEGGTVHLAGDNLDSYEYIVFGGGYRLDSLSFEILYKTNNANQNQAFRKPQLDDGLVANLSWLIF